ncbi:MAG: ATP-binding protein [Rickettsiaceae bacterium]
MILNLDTLIFVSFLLVNLIVGLRCAKGTVDIKDYALGGRSFSTTALVTTIVATWISGSGFFTTISKTYSDGLVYLIASSSMSLSFVFSLIFLVPRMGEFLGDLSVAESMGKLYGKNVRIITAICGCIWSSGFVAVQFKVFGSVFNYFLGIPGEYAILIAGFIVIIYSAFGGIRAVTYTDIVQFITFSFVIPLVGMIIWYQFSTSDYNYSIQDTLKEPMFDYKYIFSFNNPGLLNLIFLAIYFAMPSMVPTFCQRIAMGRNINQVKRAFTISALLLIAIKLSIAWIPFLIYCVNPNIEPNNLLQYIVDNYTYTGLKGLIIVGISAMAMSTADSVFNSSSVMFAHDLCKPNGIKFVGEVFLSRLFVFALGLLSLILSIFQNDLLSIVITASSFYMPIVTIPFILSIFGFRSSGKSVLIGMIAGLITVLLCWWIKIPVDAIIPGMLANCAFLFGSHYLLKQSGGWVGIKDSKYLEIARSERKRKRRAFLESVKKFSFLKFCINNKPEDDITYAVFGVFCFSSTIANIYLSHNHQVTQDTDIILYLYQTMLVTSTFFMLWHLWSPRLKHPAFTGLAWHFALTYILVFCSSFFLILSGAGEFELIIFTFNLAILFILTRWQIACIMIAIGIAAANIFYRFLDISDMILMLGDDVYFNIMYILLIMSTATLTFIKPKQERYDLNKKKSYYLDCEIKDRESELRKALELKNEFINGIDLEANSSITKICDISQMLSEKYHDMSESQKKSAISKISKYSRVLGDVASNITDLSSLSSMKLDFNMEVVDLSLLVEEVASNTLQIYKNKEDQIFSLQIQEKIFITCDKYYISRTVSNMIANVLQNCETGSVEVILSQENNHVCFCVTDDHARVSDSEIYDIFDPFSVDSKDKSVERYKCLELMFCKKVISLHKGRIWVQNNESNGCSFFFTLPISFD